MTVLCIGLAISCDDSDPEVADREADREVDDEVDNEARREPVIAHPTESADQPLVCGVGQSEAALSIHWLGLNEKSALVESSTGEVQVELVNNTGSPITVAPVLQIQQHGVLERSELSLMAIPGATTTIVKFPIARSAAAEPMPLAPATLLVGAKITAGAEPGVLWGPVAYAHMRGDALLVYREGRLRSDFGNGDLTGILAAHGIDSASTQFVDGGNGGNGGRGQ